jgi:hypothetical protein
VVERAAPGQGTGGAEAAQVSWAQARAGGVEQGAQAARACEPKSTRALVASTGARCAVSGSWQVARTGVRSARGSRRARRGGMREQVLCVVT